MPRKPAKNVPGTERFRDERRDDAGPKMHSREWHDHDEPRELEPLAASEGSDALPEAESGAERTGMGRRREGATSSQGGERRKRSTPPSKGLSARDRSQIKGTGHGRKGNREV